MRGVPWTKANRRWRASFRQQYLGEFQSFEEACEILRLAEQAAYGENQSQAVPIIAADIVKLPVFNRAGQVVDWAIVDRADYALVTKHRWCRTQSGYPITRIARVIVYLHRLLVPGAFIVDHRDRNRMNARRDNLRVCTAAENCCNTSIGRNNRSGFKGVSRTADGQAWRARIMRNRKEAWLGRYKTAEDAGRAYDAAAPRFHGQFASPNAGPEERQVPA